MPELVIRPLAKTDLKRIWHFSRERWGVEQADRYLRELDCAIKDLLRFPELGVDQGHIRSGYRALHVKRHWVFCRLLGHRLEIVRVEIVRVLHDAMDIDRHLPTESD